MEKDSIIHEFLSNILANHSVEARVGDECVYTELPGNVKFKCIVNYEEINGRISSRMDIIITNDDGIEIIECFGDIGATVSEAIQNNFGNFCRSTLHVLLATFDEENYKHSEQVGREEWEINGKKWQIIIGNLAPKMIGKDLQAEEALSGFYKTIEKSIRSQQLTKKMHWFRSYYCQHQDKITESEFLLDNYPAPNGEGLFRCTPLIKDNVFFSCRNFIVLKEKKEIPKRKNGWKKLTGCLSAIKEVILSLPFKIIVPGCPSTLNYSNQIQNQPTHFRRLICR